ncbi:hypothetical protein [Cupriavidus malaysiensis]|uniref:Uncharacterized protein n=1 Tax=Cupriavidus malaysiensis TaxID=367825 RepID=A0ABN4THW0_9BURK|nr:hypothetical protein [Cupriavidus malaysiensis]AOZ06727.1 hypothetical protein BKK80_13560 [Cupriavidus malaysiensis]
MKKGAVTAAIWWVKVRARQLGESQSAEKGTGLPDRIRAFRRRFPLVSRLIAGQLGAFVVILTFWVAVWVIDWLPWPKG